VGEAFKHNLLEYSEILLFLLVAMTYINVLEERQVFDALRSKLVAAGLTLRQLFWLTGFIAFNLSPWADNMTTALVLGAVAVAVGGSNTKFVAIACVNVVVAANAGGAYSPFGDITTLMAYAAGKLTFWEFFHLVPSSLVAWLVPAFIMNFSVPSGQPEVRDAESTIKMKPGARRVMGLFALTIATAVASHSLFHLPPVYGMLFGLSFLKIFGYFLHIRSTEDTPFDVFHHVQRLEWDTLLFFAGIILAVGGLGFIGYLELAANVAYEAWGPFSQEQAITIANVGVGLGSSVVDNIPLMFAVLTMDPTMSDWQWLLVTLAAGTGGSMLSIGSAAGVALMGSSKGAYTFSSHLRWAPAIMLGYFAAVGTHYSYAKLFAPYLF
jgi:Na+/H+ antiporter NhaD/arsenite permease-like protein